MSSRPFLKRYEAIQDGDMSADITSEVTILQLLTVGTYAYSWVGVAPVGAISVEISNDYSIDPAGNVLNPGTWIPIYFTLNGTGAQVSSAPVSGSPGSGVIEFTTGAYAIRTKYTFTSGTGLLQAVINCKVA